MGLLYKAGGNYYKNGDYRWLIEQIEPDKNKQHVISEQLLKGVNTVQTSSLGRVFDAVAAMAGAGNYNHFEAQLPMALESIIDESIEDYYDFEILSASCVPLQIDLSTMIRQLISDIQNNIETGIISAKFHNCIGLALLQMADQARDRTRINTVALSGGVFCNRYLTNFLVKSLKKNDFCVLFNRDFPSNDGGISIGQTAIAARQIIS
jgi:hydrogenase maturation protein HypF